MRFPRGRSILIEVAKIGYARAPDFDAYAPDQPTSEQRIAHALRHDPIFRDAARAEGIDPDKAPQPATQSSSRDQPALRKQTGEGRQYNQGGRAQRGKRLRAKL